MTAKFPIGICVGVHMVTGRLKMRECKMRYGQKCKGGKCWS